MFTVRLSRSKEVIKQEKEGKPTDEPPHLNHESPCTMYPSLMYISDWMSTLLHVAGLEQFLPPNVDSINMWPVISLGKKSQRKEVVLNLDQDPVAGTWSAVIRYLVGKFNLFTDKDKLDKS